MQSLECSSRRSLGFPYRLVGARFRTSPNELKDHVGVEIPSYINAIGFCPRMYGPGKTPSIPSQHGFPSAARVSLTVSRRASMAD